MSEATLSIGAVARLFDISTKALRHYEELGLLPLWQEQTIMGLLDPAGALLADLFARAAPPLALPGQPFPY